MITFLSEKLASVVGRIHQQELTPKKIEGILHEIKIAFLESDVNYKITTDFIAAVSKELVGKKLVGKNKKYKNEFVIQVLKDNMTVILDNKNYVLSTTKKPSFFMLVGLQGSGKTTTIAKLACHFQQKSSIRTLVVACDVHRPAAGLQLKRLCENINVKVLLEPNGKKVTAEEMAKEGVAMAYRDKYDLVLFDTAGRTINNKKMINEIIKLKQIVRPVEMIFIVDAMTGQGILPTAKFFNEKLQLTAAILTKFDSETRSGSAFTLSFQTNIPIVFVGVGEKVTHLEKYYPDRIVKQILGLGDLDTLMEKTKANFSSSTTEGVIKQFMSGEVPLNVMINQIERFCKMGPLKSIMRLVPGLPKLPQGTEDKMKGQLKIMKAICNSATPMERNNTKLLYEMTRKIRIIRGCGVKSAEYNKFLKSLEQFNAQTNSVRTLVNNMK